MNKKIGTAAILIALLGTSVIMWSRAPTVEVATVIEEVKEEFTCPHCGETFLLSILEQRELRRIHEAIVCPICGEKGSRKDNVLIRVSGEEPSFDTDEEEDEDAIELPPIPVGGTRRYDDKDSP